jgi:hypothetical protein
MRKARITLSLALALSLAACVAYAPSINHPTLAPPGSAEQTMDCARLDVALDRTDTVRWVIRDDGGTLEASSDRTARYAANAVLVVPLSLLLRNPVWFPDGGHAVLNAADRRILELLQLKRSRGCPARATALPGKNDLTLLGELESIQGRIDAGKGDEALLLEERTKLLDHLRLMPAFPSRSVAANPPDDALTAKPEQSAPSIVPGAPLLPERTP